MGVWQELNALSGMLRSEDATKTKAFIEPSVPWIVMSGYSEMSRVVFINKCLEPRNPSFS